MSDEDLRRRALERLGATLKGKYRLDDLIGIGGMAAVYRATHRNRAQLAVKMLHAELGLHREVRARFLREAYAANTVQHPGVVAVVDDDVTEDGTAFLVMELLDGMSVEEICDRPSPRLPLAAAVAVAHQLLDVLAAAHDAGVVHRDVKPANLFVTRDGTLKVLDFGIARVLESRRAEAVVTGTGLPIGTPAFMAPEQALARSDDIGPRTDVWAAGATLFTLLSGRIVHTGKTAAETLALAATKPAESLAGVAPDVPASIVEVVDRALEFEQERRWADAREMEDALARAVVLVTGELPSKAVLAALFPPRASTLPPRTSRRASALESAPTLDAGSSGEVGRSTDGPSPVSRTAAPVRPRSRKWAMAAGSLALALTLGVLASRARVGPRRAGEFLEAAAPLAAGTFAAPSPGQPVDVLILGIENRTTDPVFDGTLDLLLESALSRSRTLYPIAGASARRTVTEVPPDVARDDGRLGRALAELHRRPTVLVRGSVSSEGPSFQVSLRATDGATGTTLRVVDLSVEGAERSVPSMAHLSCELRAALRDTPCDATDEEETGLSPLLEADHLYTVGRGAFSSANYAEGVAALESAVALDSGFAMAHNALGLLLSNGSRVSEGQAHLELARAGAARLSERQRLTLEANAYLVFDEYEKSAAAYEEMFRRFPGDVRYRGNLAQAYLLEGDLPHALEAGRLAALEQPKAPVARANYAELELIAGHLDVALREGRKVLEDFPRPPGHAYTSVASAAALSGRRDEALDIYEHREVLDVGFARRAKADFAMYEGRLDDALATLRASLADGTKADRTDVDATWALVAEALLRKGDANGARDAALRAKETQELVTMVKVARVLAATGAVAEAELIGRRLKEGRGSRARLFARLVELDVLRARHAADDTALPADEIGEGSGSWLARADLAARDLEAGAAAKAKAELEACLAIKERVADVFFDDNPGLRYIPEVRFRVARAKDELHEADAVDAYRAFVAAEPLAQGDRLVAEARRRIEASSTR